MTYARKNVRFSDNSFQFRTFEPISTEQKASFRNPNKFGFRHSTVSIHSNVSEQKAYPLCKNSEVQKSERLKPGRSKSEICQNQNPRQDFVITF